MPRTWGAPGKRAQISPTLYHCPPRRILLDLPGQWESAVRLPRLQGASRVGTSHSEPGQTWLSCTSPSLCWWIVKMGTDPDPRFPPRPSLTSCLGRASPLPPPHPPPSPPPGASKPHSARRDPARPSRGDIPRIQGDPSVATLPNLVITEPPRPLSSRPDPASPFLPPPSGRGAWLTSLAAACSRNRPASWATEGAAEGATLALVSAGLPWKTKRERQSAADEPSAASCVPGGRARCPSRSRDSEAFEQHFAIGSSV